MLYREMPCDKRPFSDKTGTGTEYLQGGKVVMREHATRIPSAEESAAEAELNSATDAAIEREAIYQIARAEVDPAILAAKVAELREKASHA